MPTSDLIDYDRTAAEYEASLITKLRGHGVGSFLENWVPDPDPVLGIFNMIEAAWTGGRDSLALAVSHATLDAAALQRLKEFSRAIAEIRADEAGAAYRLDIKRVSGRAPAEAKQTSHAAPIAARAAKSDAEQAKRIDIALHPTLVAALEVETPAYTHEGEAPSQQGCTCVEARSENGTVSLLVADGDMIRAARHSGVKPEVRRGLVELMCREVEGRTVQDASDHAAVLAIHQLRLRAGSRPAPGILLPANAGTEVVAALELLRSACGEYQERAGQERKANFFELGPSAEWRALSQPEKLRRAADATDAFCRAEGAGATAAKAVRVDKDIHGHEIRIIVQMDGAIPSERVPFALRRLERFLKKTVEQALQVYLEPLKDKNVLRRL